LTETLLSTVRSRRGHFRLESGHHGDFWLDLETLCLRPAAIEPFATQLAALIRPYHPDAVCGPLNEGAFVALMVASRLDCDFTYAERFADPARAALYPVEYRLPRPLHSIVQGKRVAIVNDVIGAGSAVRGTFAHLHALGARVVVIGSLLVLGTAIAAFATERGVPVEALQRLPNTLWLPDDCPLCRAGVPLEAIGS
jgi:orotate phosphoribosyltransferase